MTYIDQEREIINTVNRAVEGHRESCDTVLDFVEPVLAKTTQIEFQSQADYSRDDIINELRMHVLVKLSNFKSEKGRFETWTRTLAKNYVRSKIRFLRAAKRNPGKTSSEVDDKFDLGAWLVSQIATPEKLVRKEERNAAIAAALATLEGDEQDIAIRRYYWRQTIPQIAQETSRTAKEVEKMLISVKRKLVVYLGSASQYFSSS